MSESLRECEREVLTKTSYDAVGEWKCAKDGEKIQWVSSVRRELADASPDPKGFVEAEHRQVREEVAREIEKHIGGH